MPGPAWTPARRLAVIVGLAAAAAGWGAYPKLSVEITPEHPLFLFDTTALEEADPAGHANRLISAWASLEDDLKPQACLIAAVSDPDPAIRHERFRLLLARLQEAAVPIALRIRDPLSGQLHPTKQVEELLSAFTCVKGVEIYGISFAEYPPPETGETLAPQPLAQWLIDIMDRAAQYGRFIALPLDGINAPRLMANRWLSGVYAQMAACHPHILPIAQQRGPHTVPQTAALLGLWLEGAADNWGIGADARWYTDAQFLEPGRFGPGATPEQMPPSFFRAMIFNGAMTGACVYTFSPPSCLWFGTSRRHWDEAILPTLREITEKGYIARKDLVQAKARVAYQLTPARNAAEFHINLRDIDPILDTGLLIHGAYGVEEKGLIPELVLNSGRHYWVPLLSPYATPQLTQRFAAVGQPAQIASAQDWTRLLDQNLHPDGQGSACIIRIGRAIFIMHTRENRFEEQSFRIPDVPAPVRGLEVSRQPQGVILDWPMREGDVEFTVYRRAGRDSTFTPIAARLDQGRYTDTSPPPQPPLSYAITALTTEREAYEGTVNYGDFLVISAVMSRITEEAVVSETLGYGRGRPLERPPDTRPVDQTWWPNYAGVPEQRRPSAELIVQRIERWAAAFAAEDLDAILECYTTDYRDPQGWGFEYARRAYQWFFERYNACVMSRQIREWDFSRAEGALPQVNVLLFCRFEGYTLTDPSGRFADQRGVFPRNETLETWVTFVQDGAPDIWRIQRTNPAVPNFRDILSYSAGPYDAIRPGPDIYQPRP